MASPEAPLRSPGTTKIFLHVPKCGGTTLTRWLESSFPDDRRFHVDPRDIARSRAELARMPAEERTRIDLLLGHLSYGWHELLPRPCSYFTFLREPVDRVISHYSYVRWMTRHEHYLRAVVEVEDMSPGEYVASGICDEVNNGRVRLLSRVEDIVQEPYGESRVRYGSNDRELLDRALENIESHFVVVGVLERFDAGVKALCDAWGIPPPTRPRDRKNVGGRYYEKVAPTSDELEVIREHNRLDIELYERVSAHKAPAGSRIDGPIERIASAMSEDNTPPDQPGHPELQSRRVHRRDHPLGPGAGVSGSRVHGRGRGEHRRHRRRAAAVRIRAGLVGRRAGPGPEPRHQQGPAKVERGDPGVSQQRRHAPCLSADTKSRACSLGVRLVSGDYFMDIYLPHERVEYIIKLENVLSFHVQPKPVDEGKAVMDRSRGLIVTPHRWNHEPEPDAISTRSDLGLDGPGVWPRVVDRIPK